MMTVDGEQVYLNDFVKKMTGRVLDGVLISLRGVESGEKEVTLSLGGEADISLQAGGAPVHLNEFVKRLLTNVVIGIAGSLDGVPEQPAEITITMTQAQGAEQ
jgi:hypothetical protein